MQAWQKSLGAGGNGDVVLLRSDDYACEIADNVVLRLQDQAFGAGTFVDSGNKFVVPGGNNMIYLFDTSADPYNYSATSTNWRGGDYTDHILSNHGYSVEGVGFHRQVTMKPDGTKIFILNSTNDRMEELTLSVAWDLTTNGTATNFSFSTQDSDPCGIAWKSDGTKLFMAGRTNDAIYQYDLTTAWDVSTMSYSSNSRSVATDLSNALTGLVVNNAGTKMLCFSTDCLVKEYNLTVGWDLSTCSGAVDTLDLSAYYATTCHQAIVCASDATEVAFTATGSRGAQYVKMSTACDLSTQSPASVSPWNTTDKIMVDVVTDSGNPTIAYFNSDGTKINLLDYADDDWHIYTLTTAYDISTASYSSSKYFGASATLHYTFCFNDDGTSAYGYDVSNDRVDQWDLTTAYDMSTATYNQTSGALPAAYQGFGMAFSPDGMYMIFNQSGSWHTHALTVAYDISTLSTTESDNLSTTGLVVTGRYLQLINGDWYCWGQGASQNPEDYQLVVIDASDPANISTATTTTQFALRKDDTGNWGITYQDADDSWLAAHGGWQSILKYSLIT